MNVVGNEITNSGFPYGLFMLNGQGHYSFGNNVYGTTNPSGTSNLTVRSLYLDENDLPAFLGSEILPMVGYPLSMNEKEAPSEIRFGNNQPISCVELVTAVTADAIADASVQLFGNRLRMDATDLPATLSIYTADGRLILSEFVTERTFDLSGKVPQNLLLIIRVQGKDGTAEVIKTIY